MTDIVLNPLASMQTPTLLNDNLQKVEDSLNSDVVHTSGGKNVMLQDLDLNGNNLLNVATDPTNPNSLAKIEDLGTYGVNAKASADLASSKAVEAANSAAQAAGSASSAAASVASAEVSKGYATKALMDADLSPADGTIRLVTNDATTANNQTYRKSGAPGTGSWVASVDRIAKVSQDLANTTDPTKASALVAYVRQAIGSRIGSVASMLDAKPGNLWEYSSLAIKPVGQEGDPTKWDWTAALQACINNHYLFEVPAGSYNIRKVTWRSNVCMRASGSVSFYDIPGDTNDCMFSFGQSGFLQQWSIEGQIRIVGCGNTTSGGVRGGKGKIGMLLDSTADGTGQGGNWYFWIKGVRVLGFSGPQIWERGGQDGNSSQVNQFGVYSNVFCLSQTSVPGSYAFLASGKNGQRFFDAGCLFQQNNTDICFRICRYMDASGTLTGADGHAYNFVAVGTSFQQGNPCISVERGQICSFKGVYLELGLSGALFTTSAEQCYFDGILNSSHANSGSGYGIRVGSIGAVNVQALTLGNVEINGTGDIGIDGGSTGAGANGGILFAGAISLSTTTTTTPFKNCTAQPGVSSGAVNLSGRNTAIVSGPATISTITSNAAPGQMVTLKAHNGALTFDKTGNITLPSARTTLTIPKDAAALFVRMDLAPNGYMLVGAIDPTWA